MPENDILQKLAHLASEMSDQMSAEQWRLYNEFVSKKLEAKLAEDAFYAAANLESAEDEQVSESLRDIRKILSDPNYRLSGTETVLLASYHKQLEGDDRTDTKRLNIFLHSHDRKPANTTKIVDTLSKKKLMETRSDGMHSHKTFALTVAGQNHVQNLIEQLIGEQNRERLSVVD